MKLFSKRVIALFKRNKWIHNIHTLTRHTILNLCKSIIIVFEFQESLHTVALNQYNHLRMKYLFSLLRCDAMALSIMAKIRFCLLFYYFIRMLNNHTKHWTSAYLFYTFKAKYFHAFSTYKFDSLKKGRHLYILPLENRMWHIKQRK